MVLAMMDISDMNYSRIRRGQYGCGDEYLLLPELRYLYDINDPGAVPPPKVTIALMKIASNLLQLITNIHD